MLFQLLPVCFPGGNISGLVSIMLRDFFNCSLQLLFIGQGCHILEKSWVFFAVLESP